MSVIGVLCAVHPRSDLPGLPKAGLMAGGISLIVRGLRQLQAAGASHVYVLAEKDGIEPPALPSKWQGMDVITLGRALDLVTQIDDGDIVMMIEEGVLVDTRLVQALAAVQSRHALMVWPATSTQGVRASRIDPAHSFASVLKTSGQMLRTVAKGLGDWDLEQTLIRQVATQVDTVLKPASDIDLYNTELCRNVPLLWQPIGAAADEDVIGDDLIAATVPACRDWPATFIHPFLGKPLLRLVMSSPLGSGHIVLIVILLGICATIFFTLGWGIPALSLTLIYGVVEPLGFRLKQIKAEPDKSQPMFELVDKAIEYSWYLAMAAWLSRTNPAVGPWAVAALIMIESQIITWLTMVYWRFTTLALADAGPAERRGTLIGGCRNCHMWSLIPFALSGFWYAGFIFLAIYGALTLFWAQFRFFMCLRNFTTGLSTEINTNFQSTAYAFLPWRKSSSSK